MVGCLQVERIYSFMKEIKTIQTRFVCRLSRSLP